MDGLAAHGFAVVPGYFSSALVKALRDEAGELRPAGVGRGAAHRRVTGIRGDRIRWLDGATLAQCHFLEQLETLRLAVNRALYLGLFDLEAHFAVYGPGACYKRHLDAFAGNNSRVVSVVAYLNDGWSRTDGGCLRLWATPESRRHLMDIEPRAGTLVSFLSEQIPHEVLPARRDRTSIAGWFRRNRTTTECIDVPA